jgi:hypothetical protein
MVSRFCNASVAGGADGSCVTGVALARRLAIIMHAMLRDATEFASA